MSRTRIAMFLLLAVAAGFTIGVAWSAYDTPAMHRVLIYMASCF